MPEGGESATSLENPEHVSQKLDPVREKQTGMLYCISLELFSLSLNHWVRKSTSARIFAGR